MRLHTTEPIGTGVLVSGLTQSTTAYATGVLSAPRVIPVVAVGFLGASTVSPRATAGHIIGQITRGSAAAALLPAAAKSLPGSHDASVEGIGSKSYGTHPSDGRHLGAVIVVGILLTTLLVSL